MQKASIRLLITYIMRHNMPDKIDICPNCNSRELRGYDNHNLIACWDCEWTIDKHAWLEAWK
mgnify:CR=1